MKTPTFSVKTASSTDAPVEHLMKKTAVALLAVSGITVQTQATTPSGGCRIGEVRPLEEEFLNPPPGYGEVPFWWWTGDRLDKRRIAEQLRELHAKGVSGTQVN